MEFLILGPDEKLLATLDEDLVKSAKQTEAINGTHLFEISVTGTDKKAIHLKEGNLVAFEDIEGDFQLYEVVQIIDIHGDGSEKQAVCEHSNLELLDEHIEDIRPTNQTARYALSQALAGTRWQLGVVADLGIASTNFYRVNPKEAITKIIESWGGEVRYRVTIDENRITGRFVDLLARRGADTGKVYERGKDLLEITRAIDITSIKTAVRGYGKGEEIGEGYSRRITFKDIEWKVSNGDPINKPKGQDWIGDETAKETWGRPGAGGSRRHRFGKFEDSEEENPLRLLEKTYAYLLTVNQPIANYQGRVVDLFRLKGDEYRHERASLGDTAAVLDDEVSPPIEAKARIIELIRDLLNPGYDEAILGQYLPLNADHDAEIDKIIGKVKENSGVWDNPDLEVRPDKYPNIKPSKPEVKLEESFETIQLYWNFVEGEYYTQTFEVYASEVQGFTTHPESLVFKGLTNSYGFVGQTNKQYYFRVRAINFSGTASEFSEEMTGNTVRIISDDILFGPEVAAELRELSKTAELLAEGSVSVEQMKEEALAKIQETAKQYTDAEMKEATETFNQDLAKKAGISYVDGKFSTANSNLQNAVTNINLSLAEKAGLNYVDGKFSIVDSNLEAMLGDINLISGDVSGITTRINSLQNVSSDLQSRIALNEQELSANGGRMTTIDTDINVLEGTMSTTIAQLTNVESTITDQQTKIEANASAISLKANKASLDTLSGEVDDINAELSVQAGQIELKAEASMLTSVDNKVAGVRNDLSILQVSVTGISTSVSSLRSDLDGMEIGGRNMILETRDEWFTTRTASNSAYGIYKTDLSHVYAELVGQPLMISFEVKIERAAGTGTDGNIRVYGSNGSPEFVLQSKAFSVSTEWKRVNSPISISKSATSTGQGQIEFYGQGDPNTLRIHIRKFKLERGTKATDWSPAPEDVDAGIERVQQFASQVDQKADSIISSVSSLSQLVDGNKTAISNAQSSITQLSNSIALKAEQTLVESLAGEVSSVQSDVSSLVVDINGVSTSVTSLRNDLNSLDIGGRNLILRSLEYDLIREYSGARALLTPNFAVSDWGTAEAYRFEISGGTSLIKAYRSFDTDTQKMYGVTYTLSVYVLNKNDKPVVINSNRIGGQTVAPNQSKRVVITGSSTGGAHLQLQLRTEKVSDNIDVVIWQPKLERGNKATDWTPAPEDVNNAIDTVQQFASKVDQKADSIISTVSALTKTVNGHTTSISNAESSITQLSNSIALKAEQTQVNSIAGEVSSVKSDVSTLSISVNGISASVTSLQSEVEGLEIGGRNLLKDTSTEMKSVNVGTYYSAINEGGVRALEDYQLSIGDTVTFRVFIDASNNSLKGGRARISMYKADNSYSSHTGNIIPLGSKGYSTVTATIDSGRDRIWFAIQNSDISVSANEAIPYKEAKVEKGNIATDWTPAPEDMDARISSAETSITQLSNSIELKASQTSVNGLSGRMSQAESSLSVQAGQIATRVERNGIVSAINQTAEQVKINAGMIDLVGDVYITNGRTYISNLAVDSAAIANGAITRAKLGTAVIGTAQIEDATITSAKILSLNADKINASTLSAISANLGSINTGSITTLQMKGVNNHIFFGESSTDFDGRVDYADNAFRFQRDRSTYLRVNPGGTDGQSTYRRFLFQLYAAGSPIYSLGHDGGSNMNRLLTAGNTTLKFLSGSAAVLQIRNTADTAYTAIAASEFITASSRDYKMNIEALEISGLDVINSLTAVTYDLIEDIENGRLNNRQTGFISEDSWPIATPDGKAISIYKLGTLSAKAIQELTGLYYDHDQRINKLELENQLLKARISALESCS